ncbi:HlyD family type I secretion periplasmic adaptor subunit [Brevundimonas faecalis]|uniref:HlyD family type I secretion periplasmic adaptor subunit n=1 Tax=Brevundimonas faecalis TaxID=947378 RepID=UPI0036204749
MSLSRHWSALREAWKAENQRRRAGVKEWRDKDFLPAALEIAETPPSPVGRAVLWTIIAAALTALLWTIFSFVDVVAVGEGRLVPTGRLRSVEAAEAGVIRAIQVREGQPVRAGQVVIELDPTFAAADADTARSELATARLIQARADAILTWLSTGRMVFVAPEGAAPAGVEAERLLVEARIREHQANLAALTARRSGARSAALTSAENVARYEETLPLARQQLTARQDLERQGLAPRLRVLEQEERYIALSRELSAERHRQSEAQAQVAMIDREQAQAREAFRGEAAREKAEAEAVVATRTEGLTKADQRQSLQRLTAPVAGVVNEVSVTTLGEVAEAGQSLITIVPDGEDLIVEALILNRDVGFVRPGMRTVVKLEAYPFTRYGSLEGVVEHVSPDATVDEVRGLVFPARVRLTKTSLRMGVGEKAVLQPGMAATVEIVTGRRRVIEYLLSPIAKAVGTAGRER